VIIEIQSVDPSIGYELCIYPRESRRKRASWIMWIAPDGSADLYTERSETGAIQGEPIHLPPNVRRPAIDEQFNKGVWRSDDDDDEPVPKGPASLEVHLAEANRLPD
jgi:hypothetical protein